MTDVRAAAVLNAAVVATTKTTLVVAFRTLRATVAQLGLIDAHIHGGRAFELAWRAAERQAGTVELLVRVIATVVLAITGPNLRYALVVAAFEVAAAARHRRTR